MAATTKRGAGRPQQTRQSESVSGNVSVIGVWTGPEQESFQAVIDGFTAENPDVTVKYTSGGDNIVTVLSTAVEGGNPPDVATVSQPGTMADFVERGALQPLDFAADAVTENFGESIVEIGSVDGTLYGLLFKAANKSTIWYNAGGSSDVLHAEGAGSRRGSRRRCCRSSSPPCVLSPILHKWWPLELAGLMLGIGLAVDVTVDHGLLPLPAGLGRRSPLGVLRAAA